MTQSAVVDTSALGKRRGARGQLKGRTVDPQALAEVARAAGRCAAAARPADRVPAPDPGPLRLHLRPRTSSRSPQEMKLAMTEVYEVATFYHHFDVVKEGEAPPPPLTVRVCETLSCQMAGARRAARRAASGAAAAACACIGAPCIGRCEHAPAAVVGRNPVDHATRGDDRRRGRRQGDRGRRSPPTSTTPRTAPQGGYRTLRDCVDGERTRRRGHRGAGGFGLARPGRRRLSGGPQVEASCAPSPRRA